MDGKKTYLFLLAVSLVVLLVPGPAFATISAFKFLGIDGIGDTCGLNDRIGKISGATTHVINIDDCDNYDGCSMEVKWGLDRTPASGATYVVKMSNPGGACVETDFTTLGTTCNESLLVLSKSISSPNYMTFSVTLDELIDGDCNAGTDLGTTIYIIVNEGGTITSEAILFDVDLDRPAPPELQESEEGDSNITVKWKAIDDSSDSTIEYFVYWSDSIFSDATKANADVEGPMSGTSYQVTTFGGKDLVNDTEYFFAVSSQDENDNESPLSSSSSAMPIDVRDFWEMYQSGGGNEDGGFCFVATAAWGSYMAPEVRTLRAFRDQYLLTNGPGRLFVRAYYAASPPLARFISESPALKAVARVVIAPFVVLARALVAMPVAFGFAAVVLLMLLSGLFISVAVRAWRRS